MDTNKLEQIVSEVISKLNMEMQEGTCQSSQPKIPVEASGRHIHLSKEDAMTLFGTDELTVDRELSQPGQYLYKEKVMLIGPKGVMKGIAVLGPCRGKTQVELSSTDARSIGLKGIVRDSGDLDGTESVMVSAGGKVISVASGVIVARRHIHMTPDDAICLSVKDREIVSVRVTGNRPLIFEDVLIRVSEKFRLSMHIDYDEANAVGLNASSFAEITL